jgi:hypothetical protein
MEVETPPLKTLSDHQVEVIRNTWATVNATVRKSFRLKIIKKVTIFFKFL